MRHDTKQFWNIRERLQGDFGGNGKIDGENVHGQQREDVFETERDTACERWENVHDTPEIHAAFVFIDDNPVGRSGKAGDGNRATEIVTAGDQIESNVHPSAFSHDSVRSADNNSAEQQQTEDDQAEHRETRAEEVKQKKKKKTRQSREKAVSSRSSLVFLIRADPSSYQLISFEKLKNFSTVGTADAVFNMVNFS